MQITFAPAAHDYAESIVAGRRELAYFKLWRTIVEERLEPAEFLPGRGRKPEAVFREA